jgi:hypothetical protein
MSKWAHGKSVAKRCKNLAAVTEPAETLRETLFGAIGADLQRVESRLR